MKRFVFAGIAIAVVVFGVSMVFLSNGQQGAESDSIQAPADAVVEEDETRDTDMAETEPDENRQSFTPIPSDDAEEDKDTSINGPIVKNGEVDLDAALAPRFIGDDDAPVVVHDFSSLSCPHCADLHTQTLPPVKREYVDTGKLKIVFRDFPLNRAAMIAHSLARCVAPNKYAGALSILYDNQDRWIDKGNPTEQIISLLRITGLSEAEAVVCLQDQGIQDGILANMRAGQRKYNITSTPTLVFENGPSIRGASSPERIGRIVERLMRENGENTDG